MVRWILVGAHMMVPGTFRCLRWLGGEAAISGDVPQNKRQRMLQKFQQGELQVLIGTDVASRGLHIPDVRYVINYDLPQDAEDYVHRIGRTARAGASGDAISFGCETYAVSLPDIEEFISHKIPVSNYDPTILPKLVKPKYRPRKILLTEILCHKLMHRSVRKEPTYALPFVWTNIGKKT